MNKFKKALNKIRYWLILKLTPKGDRVSIIKTAEDTDKLSKEHLDELDKRISEELHKDMVLALSEIMEFTIKQNGKDRVYTISFPLVYKKESEKK